MRYLKISLKVLLSFLAGGFIGMIFLLWLSGFNEFFLLIFKMIASSFLAIGVIYAARQFYLNQKQLEETGRWNRQHTAMIEANKANKKIEKIINKLKKRIDYGERKEAYKISEVHNLFGEFSEDGRSFNFHSDGTKIKHWIISLLNTFEYIATGVNLGIFDEEVIKRLWRSKLLYAYKMFASYISHLREEHGWKNVYSELETLSKRWDSENSTHSS